VSAAKHTPGPWEAVYGVGAGWNVRRSHSRLGYEGLAPICSMAWFQFDIPEIINDEISGANARLIAAAPDLLAALESLCGERIPSREDFEAARDVIAKAKGES
jgi:hypothetical protein